MPRKSSLTYQESLVLSLAEEGTAIRVMWNDEGTVPWKKKKKILLLPKKESRDFEQQEMDIKEKRNNAVKKQV